MDDLFKMYLAGQLGHLSGQIDVWAVGQRTATPGLLTGLVTVADLREMRPSTNFKVGLLMDIAVFQTSVQILSRKSGGSICDVIQIALLTC